MADSHLPEDEATLYVLGELPAARRAEFEARMADSAELRRFVRELEEGTAALSIGSPQRRPPLQVWNNIEEVVSRGNGRETSVRTPGIGWWRNGWAVAAASIVGWVLYAFFVNLNHGSPAATPHETTVANVPQTENPAPKPPAVAPSNANIRSPRIQTEEVIDLRLKIAQLEKETGQLSQLVVQQRTLLAETNRIKFYHLNPVAAAGSDAVTAQLSPALQRAVFISLGRELGWLPAASTPRVGLPAGGHPTVNNIEGVDFVDLRPAKNEVGNQAPAQPTPAASAQQPTAPPETESQPTDAAPAIPAFISGDKMVVALDPTVVPPNSSLAFSTYGLGTGSAEGNVVMGSNPMVVTVPYSLANSPGGGLSFSISTVTPAGQSNTTQFFVPSNP
jgi:hypothetical protein